LNLQQVETFWLSETPSVAGSKSWDAAITRIVTWAKFKDKKSGKTFYHFNTHFDHVGKVARAESARIILHAVDSIAGGFPAIVTGDFNATIDDEPMQILLSEENLPKLVDTKVVSTTRHYGPGGTFNAFGSKENNTKPIDHILFMGKWKVTKHATLSQTWGGLFSSDHFPVLAQMSVQKK
jgi:endonuclease/exonuclease/phosphatase family metal-dependent hydrolase